jgi:hypothetical protein
MSIQNFFIKKNINNSITITTPPAIEVNFDLLRVSFGLLPKPAIVTSQYNGTSNTILLNWFYDYNNFNLPTDEMFCAYFNLSKNEAAFSLGEFTRSAGIMSFSCPSGWIAADIVYAYHVFKKADKNVFSISTFTIPQFTT